MRIKISDTVLNNPLWHPILDIIITLIEDQRHTFDPEHIPDIIESNWIKSRPRNFADLIRTAATHRSYNQNADKSLIIITIDCRKGGACDIAKFETTVHPSDALQFLFTPFQVIVENEWFDGAFLLWMAKAAGFQKLIEAYRKGRFVFRHAGGKDSLPRCAEVFSNGVWPRKDNNYHRAMRLWLCAILDSDAKHPSDIPNKNIILETTQHVSFVHQLRKRSIENYIPIHFLKKYNTSTKHQRKTAAFERLPNEQKEHYHMKVGFQYRAGILATKQAYMSSTLVSQEEKGFFSSIHATDWQELAEGFGGNLSDTFVFEKFRPNLDDINFTNQADRDEIISLSTCIYERL